MVNLDQLVEQAKALGFNLDEKIYSLCIEDVLNVIYDTLEDRYISADGLSDDEVSGISDDELRTLIEHGKKGTEWIDWHETLYGAILDKLLDLKEERETNVQ